MYNFPSVQEEIFVRTDVFFRRLFAGGGDALHEGGMDKGGGDGHEAGNADDQPAVAAETEEFALRAFEDTARDAHTVAFLKGYFGQGEIEQLFVLRTGHGYEVAHFALGHSERLCRLAVHIETHRHAAFQLLLEGIDALAGGVGKDQIVHHGEEALDALPAAVGHEHLLHGQEIANALCIEVLLELELAAVRDTQDIPLFFCTGGKRRHGCLQKIVFGGHRILIFPGLSGSSRSRIGRPFQEGSASGQGFLSQDPTPTRCKDREYRRNAQRIFRLFYKGYLFQPCFFLTFRSMQYVEFPENLCKIKETPDNFRD